MQHQNKALQHNQRPKRKADQHKCMTLKPAKKKAKRGPRSVAAKARRREIFLKKVQQKYPTRDKQMAVQDDESPAEQKTEEGEKTKKEEKRLDIVVFPVTATASERDQEWETETVEQEAAAEEREKEPRQGKKASELEEELSTLRSFICHELGYDVVLLSQAKAVDLPYTATGQVDARVLSEREWARPTTNTVYVWDASHGPEKEGKVAFAVFYEPEALKGHEKELLKVFSLSAEYRYPLIRKSTKFKEKGKCFGVGYRPGYEAKTSFGTYKAPKKKCKAKQKKVERVLECFSARIAQTIEETVGDHLPAEWRSKARLVKDEGIPTLPGTTSCPHILLTIDYSVNDHNDSDMKGKCACGVWLEKHHPSCRLETCCDHWAFLLPEYGIAIPLRDGTFLAWDAADVSHCTVLEKNSSCSGHEAYSIVTQIKEQLVLRVRSSKRKNK